MEGTNQGNYPDGIVHKAEIKVHRANGRNGAMTVKMFIVGASMYH